MADLNATRAGSQAMNRLHLSIVVLLLAIGHSNALAAAEWYRGLDLEGAIAQSDLIVVARVADVSETAIMHGGKGEAVLRQFAFEPVRTLKGVFARKELSLTANDLGGWRYSNALNEIEKGQLRLLLLTRTGPGYANRNEADSFAHAAPVLTSETDPLIAATSVLISVTQQHDRARRVEQALAGLGDAKGAAVVVLLKSVAMRALLASQTPGAVDTIVARLNDPSPAVREEAAITLRSLLDADYFVHQSPREKATRGAISALGRDDRDVAARVAAIRLLGVAVDSPTDRNAARWYDVATTSDTFAETAARLRTAAELKLSTQRDAVRNAFLTMPLDASYETEYAAGLALIALAPDIAPRELRRRYDRTREAGLNAQAEIALVGELPAQSAVTILADVAKTVRDQADRTAVMMTAQRIAERDANAQLTPIVASMLDERLPDLRWRATNVLMKIDTDEAARALQPHLKQEPELLRKLQMAEFLGRHGLRDGYPYALEHMSEPGLQEQAVLALAAIRDPASIETLRNVLASSNDERWNGAALRALGALGDRDIIPRCLELARDLQHPLAPAALIALGDLGEPGALDSVRAALASRNERVLAAGVRAAGKLSPLPNVAADDLRARIAAVLADASAPIEARRFALDALLARDDSQINDALSAAIVDAGLEGSKLLSQIEELAGSRKLELAERAARSD
jgi:HEAT repeat protein